MKQITMLVSDELFRFTSYRNWVATAQTKFHRCGLPTKELICVDAKGRVCRLGREFDRAERDEAFPITVHAIDPEVIRPSQDPQQESE